MDEVAKKRRSMERVRAHLATADSELEAAQRLLDSHTDDEFGMAVVRAVTQGLWLAMHWRRFERGGCDPRMALVSTPQYSGP